MPVTDDPNDPNVARGGPDTEPREQHDTYLVLSEDERAKGFVRPLRLSYMHTNGCGAVTTMGSSIAETYARNPYFYGSTYCAGCSMHRPVGPDGEFHWLEPDGRTSKDKVGT
jgi:hypothetical protein